MEKAITPYSSTLAWKIPWTEEPGRLQSMGSRRVRHDWATSLSLFTFMHWRRKWQPTPVFLPGESQGWGHTESNTLKWLSRNSLIWDATVFPVSHPSFQTSSLPRTLTLLGLLLLSTLPAMVTLQNHFLMSLSPLTHSRFGSFVSFLCNLYSYLSVNPIHTHI